MKLHSFVWTTSISELIYQLTVNSVRPTVSIKIQLRPLKEQWQPLAGLRWSLSMMRKSLSDTDNPLASTWNAFRNQLQPQWWKKHPLVARYQHLIKAPGKKERRQKDDCGNAAAHTSTTVWVTADRWHQDVKEEKQGAETRSYDRKSRKSCLYLMCQHFEGWLWNDYVMSQLLYFKGISHTAYHI